MSDYFPCALCGEANTPKHHALHDRIEELEAENKCLKKQKQIAIDALFSICQSDWGIGHSLAKPAHKAIKELAAVEEKDDE